VLEIPKFGVPEEVVHSAMVLVADDDTATRNLLSGLLKAQGYRVFGAQDGQEALDFLLTHDPAVALLDVMMPKLTGFEVSGGQGEPGDATHSYRAADRII
jgi:PleD family two-component response regulator